MKHEYAYSVFESQRGSVFRPVVSADVDFNGNHQFLEFIVDSGADSSMIGRDSAQTLGIELTGGQWTDVYGICGKIRCFQRKVRLAVNGFESEPFDAVVLVSDKLNLNILGDDNFFHHFKVGFDSKDRKLVLDNRK